MYLKYKRRKGCLTVFMNIKNKKIKKSGVKILIADIAGIIILLVFTRFVISYAMGEFDIPFYNRTQSDNALDMHRPGSENPATTEKPTQEITNILDVINPDYLSETEAPESTQNDPALPTGETSPVFELYSDEMKRAGFLVSDGVYDTSGKSGEYKFVRAETEYPLPKSNIISIELPAEEPSGNPGEEPAEPVVITELAVEPFMDFILIRDGSHVVLSSADGTTISYDFNALGLEILQIRDPGQNKTVFFKESSNEYYIYDSGYANADGTSGAFAGISFDVKYGDRGVPFMYPSYYGADGANNIKRVNNGGWKWGYNTYDTDSYKIRQNYNMSYNFSEDIGIAYQDAPGWGNRMFFFNEKGDILNESYFAPDTGTLTIDHLGFFYVDHGLTRAYVRQKVGLYGIEEWEAIIDTSDFTEFSTPVDYVVKAYSNGMILLEKDGYYGFMNYLGNWVAHPIYKYAQPFFEGVAVIGLKNGKKALIDTNGNLLTKFRYDHISNCTGGIISLYEASEGWTILNKVRKHIEPPSEE